jgi:hypothetical protein
VSLDLVVGGTGLVQYLVQLFDIAVVHTG